MTKSTSLRLTSKLSQSLNSASKVALSSANHALQIVALQARVWASDEEGQACRPWYVLCLEIYPRGKVINHVIHKPASRKPDATFMLQFLLDHINTPPEDEMSIRPSHVSFVDDNITQLSEVHLRRLKIKCETLTIADGVTDYIKKFSDKMIERGRATKGEASERPGLLSVKNVVPSSVGLLMDSAVQMFRSAPWSRIPEHIALQIRLPPASVESATKAKPLSSATSSISPTLISNPYREKYYVTILGSDKKIYGFAIVPSLAMLRDKYKKVMLKRTNVENFEDFEDKENSTSKVTSLASDIYVCAWCGKRVGTDVNEEYLNRCSACHKLLYCNEECQRNDWRDRHKGECKQATQDSDYVFDRPQWSWLDRELALLFLDPTSIPFDDLDAFDQHNWSFLRDLSPPLYALPFVSVQSSDSLTSRRDLPTQKELETLNLVAQALAECLSTPPSDGTLHLSNGVSISLGENLAESIPIPP